MVVHCLCIFCWLSQQLKRLSTVEHILTSGIPEYAEINWIKTLLCEKIEWILALRKPLPPSPPPPTAASCEWEIWKRAKTRDDDKLSFIVSYSEIVCNKIYVLITRKKLPTKIRAEKLRAHGIRIAPLFHGEVGREWLISKVTFSSEYIRRIGCLDGLCGATRSEINLMLIYGISCSISSLIEIYHQRQAFAWLGALNWRVTNVFFHFVA